jgi:superfamily II DNA or RNA helicase
MSKHNFRTHQLQADQSIYQHLVIENNSRCLVKMFCGTGKSLLMRKCKLVKNKNLCVYVFSSLGLIEQFSRDYLDDHPAKYLIKICSEVESTTDPIKIQKFLKMKNKKIICVTYQSFKTLVDNLGSTKIDVCIFDEAHNAVGETYQTYIFENDVCDKQIFMTATPKNANGIIMCDPETKIGACGKLVYEYSYLQGVNDDILNPFEIRIDMYTEKCNKSVYECIARSIMASNNGRVLTFHGGVDTESDTCVNNFLNESMFVSCFEEVQRNEFPEKNQYYKKITMTSLSSATPSYQREHIFNMLDETPDNEVIIVSSCQVLREGIDTKKANMCVFVDPKSSAVQIIQNIGRILRKTHGILKPNSTILLPCWVDKEKYLACDGDREKCDEVIREDMGETGNFNGILNVMSALKQQDEEIYDICLHYPDTYSPEEIKSNLEKQGFQILDPVDQEGNLQDNLEHVLDTDLDMDDYDDCDTDEELLMRVADDKGVCIEIHTTSLENPIERYNTDCESGDIVRLYKSADEESDQDIYQPIVPKKGGKKRTNETIRPPDRNRRINIKMHTNPDVKVLWNIVDGFDLTKDICSCVVDCEVVRYDPMDSAKVIVERANTRLQHNLNLLPRKIHNKNNRTTPELEQENKDAVKLSNWKMALKGKGNRGICSNEVRDYLDENLPGWRTEIDFDVKAMKDATGIVERANIRVQHNLNLLPRTTRNKNNRTTPELEQEYKDAKKLGHWKMALKGKGNRGICSDEVRDYLDENLPGWRTEIDFDVKAMKDATGIVERTNIRVQHNLNLLPRRIDNKKNRTTPELEQENKDAQKLRDWKKALKGKGHKLCSDEVRDYLDANLPGWRSKKKKSMKLQTTQNTQTIETSEQKRQRTKSKMETCHQKFKTMKSSTLIDHFQQNPQEWHEYHEISEENEKSFPEEDIPRNQIITEMNSGIISRKKKEVVDLGCGKAQISKYFKESPRFNFINYDLVAYDDTVAVCDITRTSLEDNSVDIAILCLAMWCTNREDNIKEAYRILDSQGLLFISEATKKWSDQDERGNIIEGMEACKLIEMLQRNGFQIKKRKIEKFCMFVCVKI